MECNMVNNTIYIGKFVLGVAHFCLLAANEIFFDKENNAIGVLMFFCRAFGKPVKLKKHGNTNWRPHNKIISKNYRKIKLKWDMHSKRLIIHVRFIFFNLMFHLDEPCSDFTINFLIYANVKIDENTCMPCSALKTRKL